MHGIAYNVLYYVRYTTMTVDYTLLISVYVYVRLSLHFCTPVKCARLYGRLNETLIRTRISKSEAHSRVPMTKIFQSPVIAGSAVTRN